MSRFTDTQRTVLAVLADVLIPAAEGMPAASTMGAVGEYLDQVVNFRADLVPLLYRAVRAAEGAEPAAAIQALREKDAEAFGALTLAISAGYYMNPKVKAALGYTGVERRTYDPDAVPDYVTNGLLAPVIARGPIWRQVK